MHKIKLKRVAAEFSLRLAVFIGDRAGVESIGVKELDVDVFFIG